MAEDPSNAAEIARSMAEALALAGASADDIASTMQEAMAASFSMQNGSTASPEDLLDIAETVARTMAEAGASPAEIAAAIKSAMKNAGDNPAVAEELAVTMAKAMAVGGASGEEIVKAMREAMEASGATQGEMAEALLSAMASSGVSPEEIAQTMMIALQDSCKQKKYGSLHTKIHFVLSFPALTPEEIQERVISAMVESGASPEDIAKVMVQQKLLEAVGKSPDDMAKGLLKHLRSGKQPSLKEVLAILKSGGLDPHTAAKVLVFQKALGRCGCTPDDIATAIVWQKAHKAKGQSPQSIIDLMEDIVKDLPVGQMAQDMIISLGDSLNPRDVNSMLKFEKLVDTVSVKACERVRSNKSKESVEAAVKDGFGKVPDVKPESLAKSMLLQKLLGTLDLPVDAVGKMTHLQKSMYDSGASMQDIAMVMDLVLEDQNVLKPDLQDLLLIPITSQNMETMGNMLDAFSSAALPPEVTTKLMQLQIAIESGIVSPEKSAAKFLEMLSTSLSSSEQKTEFLNLLESIGVKKDSLEKAVLIQGAFGATNVTAEELGKVMEIQGTLLELGLDHKVVAEALQAMASSVDMKAAGKVLSTALDHKRVKVEDIKNASKLLEAIENGKLKGKCSKLLQEKLKEGMNAQELAQLIQETLEENGVQLEQAGKALLVQKMMADCKCSSSELTNAIRLQSALASKNEKAETVVDIINDALDPRSKNIVKNFKSTLENPAQFSAENLEFFQSIIKAVHSNSQTPENMNAMFNNALRAAGLSKEDMVKALLVQKTLGASGISPEVMAQAVMFQKALAASGASPEEIVQILANVCNPKYSDDQIKSLLAKALERKSSVTAEDLENISKLQESLRSGNFAIEETHLDSLVAAGSVNMEVLGKAMLMQKILSASGLSPEDLGKAMLMQQTMLDSGASTGNVKDCLQKTLMESGISLEHLVTLMEIELKASGGSLSPKDIQNTLHFEKILNAAGTAKLLSGKLSSDNLRLLEAALSGESGISLTFSS